MRLTLAAAALVGTIAATPVAAQTLPLGRSGVLSIQPLNAMLTVYSGELELAMGRSLTLGAGATTWGASLGDDFRYFSGDVKLRYYPEGHALQGFSFGMSAGMTRVSASSDNTQDQGSVSGPSIGVMLDYGWLLGEQKRFYVGLGVGAKNLFVNTDRFSQSVTLRYPTARVSIGVGI